MALFLRRLAIDLGTNNVLVYIPQQGIVINEPSVVAVETETNKVMAIGQEASQMIGRTPDSISAVHPLKEGVIANYRVTQAMLRYFINKLGGRIRLMKPEIMISAPAGVTSTERRALIDAAIEAGAKSCYVIKEPVAAALGAGIPIATASGHMVIDIGGGTSEVAVISLGDIVASCSVRVGGNNFDQAISSYVRRKYGLTLGEKTAEAAKIKIGAAKPLKKELTLEVSGSNSVSGLPESVIISTNDIVAAVQEPIREIVGAVKEVLQKTPPELASDVMDKGIVLTGGGSLLRRIDDLFTKVTGVPCQLAEEPILCVVKGVGIAVEHLEAYKRSVLWAKS
ncbi:rod shape-determining protein [Candidatus Berkelbacteria bacterium]|nr:rod shape-determining protein [Candidatus Berkelbacteria bacterium]